MMGVVLGGWFSNGKTELTEPFTVAGVGGQPEEAGVGREAPYTIYVYMCVYVHAVVEG